MAMYRPDGDTQMQLRRCFDGSCIACLDPVPIKSVYDDNMVEQVIQHVKNLVVWSGRGKTRLGLVNSTKTFACRCCSNSDRNFEDVASVREAKHGTIESGRRGARLGKVSILD